MKRMLCWVLLHDWVPQLFTIKEEHDFHKTNGHLPSLYVTCSRCCKKRLLAVDVPKCIICGEVVGKGELVGRTSDGGFVHAGFRRDGSFCVTGGVASGFWNGERYVQIDWSKC